MICMWVYTRSARLARRARWNPSCRRSETTKQWGQECHGSKLWTLCQKWNFIFWWFTDHVRVNGTSAFNYTHHYWTWMNMSWWKDKLSDSLDHFDNKPFLEPSQLAFEVLRAGRKAQESLLQMLRRILIVRAGPTKMAPWPVALEPISRDPGPSRPW